MKTISRASMGREVSRLLRNGFALLIALAALFPLLMVVMNSFKVSTDVYRTPVRLFPREWTTENYAFIFNDTRLNLMESCLWTFLVALCGTLVSLLVNTMSAYVFARMEFYGKKLLFASFILHSFIPGMTTTLTSYMLCAQLGMLKSFWVLVIPGLAHGGTVFFYRQFFLNMPISFEEAALLDGSGRFGIYWRIFLPMSKAPIIVCSAGAFIGYWNAWLWPTMTVSNSRFMQVMQVVKCYKVYYSASDGYEMAASALIIIPPMVMFIIFQKYITKGFVLSGLK